tara:strand:- start:503 stop:697 length:195 start_codon:yes stop_codon:yes gene_type:complete
MEGKMTDPLNIIGLKKIKELNDKKSDAAFEKELLEDRIAVLEKDLKFVTNNIKFILKHMEKYNG